MFLTFSLLFSVPFIHSSSSSSASASSTSSSSWSSSSSTSSGLLGFWLVDLVDPDWS